jgi:pyrimidine deaminase RibD-like protein
VRLSRPARRLAALGTGVVVLAATVLAPAAGASFSAGASAAHTISSATLEPASGLTATTRCSSALLDVTAEADLSWTETPSTFAEGYTVERWNGAVLEATTTVTPRTTTTLTQTGLATATTYTWKVRALVASWTSTEVSVTASTPTLCL